MSKRSDEIRNKYIQNPPEGMTADDIRHMSEDDLLDMDYFLNEDDEFGAYGHFPRPSGPRSPARQGHIKRPVLRLAEPSFLRPANQCC